MARILAVDDSDQNLILIELYLRSPEFEVVTARTGVEALDRAHQQVFDLVLLDVVMPAIGGFEVCRRLKEDPRTASIPVIFLSARLRDEADKIQGYALGAIDYITKPVEREELLARIRAMLRLEEIRRAAIERAHRLEDALHAERFESQALRANVAALQALVDANARQRRDATLLLDDQQRILARNEIAQARFGDLPLGLRVQDAGSTDLEVLLQHAERGMGAIVLGEPGVAGAQRWYEVTSEPLTGSAFGRTARLVTIRDVSELARLTRDLDDRRPASLAPEQPPTRSTYAITGLVGASSALANLTAQVERLRQSRSTVLIQGESGTGKELVARALHYDGPFADRPFVPIHCGAISAELIESELFGHEKGSFTGAIVDKRGLFAAADGGTVFLDEIAETSHSLQVKLLRVLQLGEIRPVGASQPLRVDVRIVAATNQDLSALVRRGLFREDLYYRLEVVTLHLPALRERSEDIPALISHFLAEFNRKHGRTTHPVRSLSKAALALLETYPWPGNVRELENVLDRAFALGCGEVLQVEDLPERVVRGTPTLAAAPEGSPLPDVRPSSPPSENASTLRGELDRQERAAILRAILAAGGDKVAAARSLGMTRSTFYRRLKELGIRDAK